MKKVIFKTGNQTFSFENLQHLNQIRRKQSQSSPALNIQKSMYNNMNNHINFDKKYCKLIRRTINKIKQIIFSFKKHIFFLF